MVQPRCLPLSSLLGGMSPDTPASPSSPSFLKKKLIVLIYDDDGYGRGDGWVTTFRGGFSLSTLGSGDQTQIPWSLAARPASC